MKWKRMGVLAWCGMRRDAYACDLINIVWTHVSWRSTQGNLYDSSLSGVRYKKSTFLG